MSMLCLELLGTPHLYLGGKPLTGFITKKAQALLIYLAVTQRTHSRDVLASLFWRDMPEWQAKKNLRNILPNLRALAGSHVLITRHAVAFNRDSPYRIDVEVFQSTLASQQATTDLETLRAATSLYRDSFLAGFYVRDAPAFEDWVLLEREHLQAMAIDGLLMLARQCIDQGDVALGLATTRRLLALDSWRETAHQYQMILLAYSRQRAAALAQYDACSTILADELGVEPMEETTALYEQIKAGTLAGPPAREASSHHADSQSLPTNGRLAPSQPGTLAVPQVVPQVDWTQFPKQPACSGRDTELTQLYQWLVTDEACLVGLFGLGGQGKTTLAAQLAWSLAENGPFARILWRSLGNAPPFSTVLQGWLAFLSDASGAPLPHHVDEQLALLFACLQQQRCLLILDSVECIWRDDLPAETSRAGYEAYGQLMHQMVHTVHQSCLMLISRIRPHGFDTLAMATPAVQSLHVRGLTDDTSAHLLHTWGLTGSHDTMATLLERCSGHPLTLKLVAMTVHGLLAGDLEAFCSDALPIFDDIRTVFDQQFIKLSALEKEIMLRLAEARQPIPLQTLRDTLSQPPSQPILLEALRTLQRRSLLETGAAGLRVPHLMTEYITHYGRGMVP